MGRTFGNSGGNPPGTSWGQAVHNGAVGATREIVAWHSWRILASGRSRPEFGWTHWPLGMGRLSELLYRNVRCLETGLSKYSSLIYIPDFAERLQPSGSGGTGQYASRSAENPALQLFNMSIMSTLGVRPGVGCHTEAAGYLEFARLISPLVERDNYGKVYTTSITPPDFKKTYYTSSAKTAITLEFDQPVTWVSTLSTQFFLDGLGGKVSTGETSGNDLSLTLKAPSTATKIMYLDSRTWNLGNESSLI